MNLFQKYFLDIIKNKYASFSGKAARMEFWLFIFICFIGFIVFRVFALLGSAAVIISEIMELAWFLALIIPVLSITTRRLHDTDKRGWWQLACIVPYILTIVAGVFHLISRFSFPDYLPLTKAVFIFIIITDILGTSILFLLLVFPSKTQTRFDN
ncbi:MAG: DUF805 domain-containing protein [Elusimicrobiota bacterium]|jgi:uncharacterized membrane protein YhaH (DUF805 family)|nr:DUF805 domain-containing protein [Elusimicrobiota bacterium]